MSDTSHVVTEDDVPTDPGGHAPWSEPDDLPAVVDARTVALTYARLTARVDRLTSTVERLADAVLALSQTVGGRPCMAPAEPEPPCLHLVEGGE